MGAKDKKKKTNKKQTNKNRHKARSNRNRIEPDICTRTFWEGGAIVGGGRAQLGEGEVNSGSNMGVRVRAVCRPRLRHSTLLHFCYTSKEPNATDDGCHGSACQCLRAGLNCTYSVRASKRCSPRSERELTRADTLPSERLKPALGAARARVCTGATPPTDGSTD